jgi:hypothetical protein
MNEEDLRKNLAMAFVYLKEQQSELFEVKNQLAAVRDIMREASPNFARMFSERVQDWQNQGRAGNAEMLAKFDEIILRLRNS